MPDENYIEKISARFGKFAEWILDHRLIVSIVCILLIAGCFLSYTFLYFDFDQLRYCPDDSPVTEYYRNFLDEYGNDEFIYILYKTESGVFSLDSLSKTRDLVDELKEIPYIKKVNSVTNIEFMEGGREGDLKIYEFMEDFPETREQALRLKSKLMSRPAYLNTYISEDGEYAAIMCEVEDRPEDDKNYVRKIVAPLKELLAKPEYSDFKFHPAGNPIVLSTFHDLNDENMVIFSLLTVVLMSLLLTILFHQFKAVVSPFMVVFVTVIFVFAFMAINHNPITLLVSMIPSIVLGIGVATTVHVVSEYQIHLRAGHDNRRSIVEAVKLVGFPCFFTSATTAIGFGSLMTSSMSAIRDFGLALSVSAMIVFAVSFTILLIFLSFGGRRSEDKFKKEDKIKIHKFREWALMLISYANYKYYKIILLLTVAVTAFLIYGMTKIVVNASWLEQFGERIPMVHDFEFIDKTMGGTGNFEILLDSKEPEGVKTEKFMRTLEKIQTFANSQEYLVKKTLSVADILKDLNKSMHNNDTSFYRIPDGDNKIAQYLLLYELSGGGELEKLLSADVATARLTLYVKSADSIVYDRFYEKLVSFIESVKPDEYDYRITGQSYLSVTIFRHMTETMSKSLTMAIILISLMMIIVFRSFKVGLLSMLPNIFPVIFALGFIGHAGIWLSNITSTTGCIVIGLAVDDTIHFISRYRVEFTRLGNYKQALIASMKGVGHALAIATSVLMVGFGVFMFSRMDSFNEAGMLTAICLFVALIADFFVAPSLILFFRPFGKETNPEVRSK